MNESKTEKERTVVRNDFDVLDGRYGFCWRGLVRQL